MQKIIYIRKNTALISALASLVLASAISFPAKAQPAPVQISAGANGVDASSNLSNRSEATGPGTPKTETPSVETEISEPQASVGEQVVSYASQFIGNPYVYGGTSLTRGADCSGFVMKVYQQFGVSLPRTSRDQGRAGVDVGGLENAKPGDVVSYKGHIGIYMGQNQLVHASNPKNGIKVSPVNYKPILSIRRFV